MSIDKTNIHNNIQACVDGVTSSTQTSDLVILSNAIDDSTIDRKNYVETGDDLPDLFFSNPQEGTIYHVKEFKIPLVASDDCWLGLDGRVYRDDTLKGEIYGWGENYGHIGDGTTISRSSPTQEITSSTDWCQVSGGGYHSLALKTSGTLWAYGDNGIFSRGVLGDGTITNRSSPVQEVTSSTDWCMVSAGHFHSTALKTNGTLWAWGCNSLGRLGDGTTINISSPVQEVSSSTDWCMVSSGFAHSSALKTNGTLWGWGYNLPANIGDGTNINRSSPVQEITSSTDWDQVSAGNLHSSALKTNGTIWAWGCNSSGRLGDETIIDRSSPVQEVTSSTNWCQVSVGITHSTALKTNGTIWSWGSNSSGRLGDETIIDRSSPVQEVSSSTDWCQVSVRSFHSSALKTSGTLWAWGANSSGRLGDGTTITRSSPVQEITSSTNWGQVSAGVYHSTALKKV